MDFYEHRAASIIAEFDDTRAEKLKTNQTPTIQIFFSFSKIVDNRERKWSMKRKYGVTEHLRELNPCIDIKIPTSAIYLHISATARALNAWRQEVNCVRIKDAQKQLARTSLK